MLDLVLTAGATAIKYLLPSDNATPTPSTKGDSNTTNWNPEGPSILTSLWMLTIYPPGTKLHFDTHNVTFVSEASLLPQWSIRYWNGDSRGDLKKLILAIKLAISLCPPIKKSEVDPNNIPSINKHYLGAREGLLRLANTYRYTIILDEFKKQKPEDSLLITPMVKRDKNDKDYKPRKAITQCIHLIDRALEEGIKGVPDGELARKVQENWKVEHFNAIATYMEDAKNKVRENQNSKECPCKNELQIIQGMINGKIEAFAKFSHECSMHKFSRSVSEPPRPSPAASNAPEKKLSLSQVKKVEKEEKKKEETNLSASLIKQEDDD